MRGACCGASRASGRGFGRARMACVLAAGLLLVCGSGRIGPSSRESASAPPCANVEVTTLGGQAVRGTLRAAFPELVLDTGSDEVTLAWAQVLWVRVVAEPAAPPPASAPWRVELNDGSRFGARIDERRNESPDNAASVLPVRLPGGLVAEIPSRHLRAIVRTNPGTSAAARLRDVLAANAPRQDVIVVERGGKTMVLRGVVRRLDSGAVAFAWKTRTLRVPWDRVAGLRMAEDVSGTAVCRVTRRDGDAFAGVVVGGDATTLELRNATLGTFRLPWVQIQRIDCRSPYVTFLSDIAPAHYECTPLFTKRWPWAADKTLRGRPLRLGGREFARGIVMHSRSTLAYAIGGRYQRFVALAGILDETGGRGDVTMTVLGDGRVLWRGEHVCGGVPPRRVSVDVTGVHVLTLVVDFGDDLDLSDHACWAQARLVGVGGD